MVSSESRVVTKSQVKPTFIVQTVTVIISYCVNCNPEVKLLCKLFKSCLTHFSQLYSSDIYSLNQNIVIYITFSSYYLALLHKYQY